MNGSNRPDPISEKPMSKAPEGEGCPRCGGHVYAAEQMLARGRVSLTFSISYMYNQIKMFQFDSSHGIRSATNARIVVSTWIRPTLAKVLITTFTAKVM